MRINLSHVDEVNLCPAFFESIRGLVSDHADDRDMIALESFLDACTTQGRLAPEDCGTLAPILRKIATRFSPAYEFEKLTTFRIIDGLKRAATARETFYFRGGHGG